MRIDQLRYLTEIAKSHSMHATSVKMHISPQALSAAIKSLENEIDLVLLERSFQGTELTPVGKKISEISDEFLEKLDDILLEAHNSGDSGLDVFELYCYPYHDMDDFIPKLVMDFSYKELTLPIHVAEYSAEEINAALSEDKTQVALGFVYKLNDKVLLNPYSDYVCEPLCSMRYCCRVSARSPLSQYMSVSLKTVLKYPLLHFSVRENAGFNDFIKSFSNAPQISILKHQNVYREKLVNNYGVSLVVDVPYKNKSYMEHVPGSMEIPLKENLQRELCLIYKKDAVFTEKTKKFIDILKSYISYTLREI